MLHKQAKNYLLIQESAEISPRKIRPLLDYDRVNVPSRITLTLCIRR